ncbi:cysteine-rich receptor-like protein kinase 44 isoform X2 [Alnus glutinosa]|uniref:cysteine-rich receptor-like protein kinase 44 isoform X2 n=1 Tax=Alnus glutinosa TaxID=3517 RepID=UPI002D7A3AC5|nr:cysteine-rich receptor-like protein kinase 44 isoform X2 [Alnus glutinosa]
MMKIMACSGLLFFFSVMVMQYFLLTTAQPTYTFHSCNNTANYTSNSSFSVNLNLSFSYLNANAYTNRFYNTSTGQLPDKAYSLFLCRADISPELCQNCIMDASEIIRDRCPNQEEAFIMYDECMLRYSNRSIFSVMEIIPPCIFFSQYNISADSGRFNSTLAGLMDGLVAKANSSSDLFATGDVNYTSLSRIYGLAQCTPDISPVECNNCLHVSVTAMLSLFHGKQGGRVFRPSCNIRYEIYPFYQPRAATPADQSPPASSTSSLPDNKGNERNTSNVVIIVVPTTVIVILLIVSICIFLKMRKPKDNFQTAGEITNVESVQFDFSTIRSATDNFSDENKLGKGGFGEVYRGRLSNGQEIAVKRLSRNSGQGDVEFKNEVLLVAKLQHRNLVRLLGFCLEGNERLLIYEFVPNTSLDHYIFDPMKRADLDWERRYKIIAGIARGVLYLHEDSRLRIIHRDLKAGNILLDAKMNPKISDFGLARLFILDQTEGSTNRIVGTYGYMAPEYAMFGQFSTKSDVFSFGVLTLEIAWRNWREGTASNLIDPTLKKGGGPKAEMMRCIHISLLCVQQNVAYRPDMASVVLMLNSDSIALSLPTQPPSFMESNVQSATLVQLDINGEKTNYEVSVSELYPR